MRRLRTLPNELVTRSGVTPQAPEANNITSSSIRTRVPDSNRRPADLPSPDSPDSMKLYEQILSMLFSKTDNFNIGSFLNELSGQDAAAAQQFLYEVLSWQMNNEYNSPEEQMQRYKDAGLNPNLIYGSGNASSGNSTGAPNAPSMSGQTFQAIGSMSQIAKTLTDVQLGQADISNIKANTQKQKTETELTGVMIEREIQNLSFVEMQMKKLLAEIANIESSTRKTDLESAYQAYINDTIPLELLSRTYNLNQQELNLIQTRASIAQTIASTNATILQTQINQWTFDNIAPLEHALKQAEIDIKKRENERDRIYGEGRYLSDMYQSEMAHDVMAYTGQLVSATKEYFSEENKKLRKAKREERKLKRNNNSMSAQIP